MNPSKVKTPMHHQALDRSTIKLGKGGLTRGDRAALMDDSIEDDITDGYQRHVVVADMESNSFRCNVVIYRQTSEAEEENHPIANYPYSPAFFGKASMTQIKQTEHGIVVKAILKPPPPDDEIG